MADLAAACEKLPGWQVALNNSSFKIANPAGVQTSIPRRVGGRSSLANAKKALEGLGFSAALAQHKEESEKARKQRIAADRAKVEAKFVAPRVGKDPAPQTVGGTLTVVGDKEMYTVTQQVGPDQAAEWLNRPPAVLPDGRAVLQRPLNAGHVQYLKDVILRGEWQLTPQGVSLPTEGAPIDGQHRLWAIVESGATVPIRVTYNVPPETFYAIDTGKRRTLADQLAILGEKNSLHLASFGKMLYCWDRWRDGDTGTNRYWSNWSRA
ncbi:hypothetical protein E1091_15320, partial [Micromonospora fluostatini]